MELENLGVSEVLRATLKNWIGFCRTVGPRVGVPVLKSSKSASWDELYFDL